MIRSFNPLTLRLSLHFRSILSCGIVCALLLGCLSLTACEEDVTAILGTDRIFTIYGAFNPEADTQKVRVFPIEERLTPGTGDPIDATVTSTDLVTGDVITWQDSLLTYQDGSYGYLFWTPLRPVYEHSYRVEVKRSDGATSAATVEVPPLVDPIFQDPNIAPPNVTIPLLLDGDAPRIVNVEVEYWIKYDSSLQQVERITIPYYERIRKKDGNWVVDLALDDDFDRIQELLLAKRLWKPSFGIGILDVTIRMLVVNESWNPPDGVFDPNVMVEPGTMSNVENGFGFIGAGYPIVLEWRPSDEAMEVAGFRRI